MHRWNQNGIALETTKVPCDGSITLEYLNNYRWRTTAGYTDKHTIMKINASVHFTCGGWRKPIATRPCSGRGAAAHNYELS